MQVALKVNLRKCAKMKKMPLSPIGLSLHLWKDTKLPDN